MKNKREIVFISIVVLLVFLLFALAVFRKNEGMVAHVFVNNVEVKALDISEDIVYSPPGLDEVVIKVKDGKIRIEESDCKDQLCVYQGAISNTHEKIVCLPNKIVITISGGDKDFDGVL